MEKRTITVKQGLSENGGSVLVYDKAHDWYYSVELKDLFRRQDEEIAALRRENAEYRKSLEEQRKLYEEDAEKLKEEFKAHEEESSKKINELVENYKSLANKLIDMVTTGGSAE